MKETKFIEQNREKWAEYEQMLQEGHRDPDKLNDLFVQITDDLSYARTFYPNRSVRVFLNSLAQKVFYNIYRGRYFPAGRFRLFWTEELPRVMWDSRQALLLSFALFALAFGIGVVSSMIDSDFARIILGDYYVEMTEENIRQGRPMAIYNDSGPFGSAAGIAANNLFVALLTAILGVLASLGTVLIMLRNGVMVGAFQYFFIEKGVFWDSFLTIWIHGTLEISAIIIAGAAGLVAGSGLLFPGTYRRAQAFQMSMRRGLKIFIGIVPIIILAAIFEGFLTRYTETPDFIRGAFIAMSLFFVLWYFVWLPWHKARSGAFANKVEEKELAPDRTQVVDFKAIKTVGEILSDAFTVLSRHPRTTLLGLFATAGAFVSWVMLLSERAMGDLFQYPGTPFWPFDILAGTVDFFDNTVAPGLFFFQALLLAMVSIAGFRALEQEMDAEWRPPLPLRRALLAGLPLLLVMPGFAFGLGLFNDFLGIAFSWVLLPFCSLLSAVIYFETLNPITALLRSFALARWGALVGMGFLAGLINLLFFMFLESPVWEMALELFGWLAPSDASTAQAFHIIVTSCAAAVLLYFFFLLTLLSGGLQYFSFREINDAASLREELDNIGKTRKIRGLARE